MDGPWVIVDRHTLAAPLSRCIVMPAAGLCGMIAG